MSNSTSSSALYTRAKTTEDDDDNNDNNNNNGADTNLLSTMDEEIATSTTTTVKKSSLSSSSQDNGPETRYRDNPEDLFAPASAGTKHKVLLKQQQQQHQSQGSGSGGVGSSKKKNKKQKKSSALLIHDDDDDDDVEGNTTTEPPARRDSDEYHFDAESDIPFTPINLDDDDDDEDDDEEEEAEFESRGRRQHNHHHPHRQQKRGEGKGKRGNKIRSNPKMKARIFDDEEYNDGFGDGYDYGDDDDDSAEGMDRIHVGGGLGRHGSQTSWWGWCPRRCCSSHGNRACCGKWYCCGAKPIVRYSQLDGSGGDGIGGGGRNRGNKAPKTSRGPNTGDGTTTTCRVAILSLSLMLFIFSCGYLGFEAGMPAQDNQNETKGEEWLEKGEEWIEHSGEKFKEWKTTWKPPSKAGKNNNKDINNNGKSSINDNGVKNPYSSDHQLTSSQLLHLSEHIFQTCSERSLLSSFGRDACLELCHGHFCCFEKDIAFGSCVADPYSYCFAYASCENVIQDFRMSNTNVQKGYGGMMTTTQAMQNLKDVTLNSNDVKLLMGTCTKNNIATLDGIRDCTAFCQHHLCCFSEDENENCRKDHPGECQAYEACKILVKSSDANDGNTAGSSSGATAVGGEADKHSPAAIQSAVQAVCDVEGKHLVDDSWVTACHSLCANYLCCFSTDGTKSNCRDVYGDETCDAYAGCGILYSAEKDSPYSFPVVTSSSSSGWEGFEGAGQVVGGDSSSSSNNDNGWDEPSNNEGGGNQAIDEVTRVNNACTEKIERNPLLKEECRLACDSRSCCYKSGPGNCYVLNTEWCDEFDACQMVLN